MPHSEFHIYNASAGSGKTFSLVKSYLVKLLSSKVPNAHRKILSLTFTNKAVNEMKARIINALDEFSRENILHSEDPLFEAVCEELDWPALKLHKQAGQVLDIIIHDYGFFEVMTIDKFNQRLIRNFARDLGINTNFDIEMDAEDVLAVAVDNLIAKAGTDTRLTQTLIGFALEKAEDDKSFNIAFDFNKIAKILLNENHYDNLSQVKGQSLENFSSLNASLISKKDDIFKELQLIVTKVLDQLDKLVNEHGALPARAGHVRSYFQRLNSGSLKVEYTLKWMESIDSEPLYSKSSSPEIADALSHLQPEIVEAFKKSRILVGTYQLYDAIYRNLIPMSVLHLIQLEINNIKEDQNIVLISEFNPIVAKHLKTQPADFIYERIGERYKHFFIDEFQDTSVLQWENLVPLIDNALAGENSSAMIVGDAKQSIYRWRGGKPEQFINLFQQSENPFQIRSQLHSLDWNFRSHKEIVTFNNQFFSFLSEELFQQSSYRNVYTSSAQKPANEAKGYVRLKFLEYEKVEHSHDLYGAETLDIITGCLKSGLELHDICILTRRKEEARELVQYLNQHSEHDIISPDSLLLVHSEEVRFVIDFLHFLAEPSNLEYKFNVLQYLSGHMDWPESGHQFITSALHLNASELERLFTGNSVNFKIESAKAIPLYELIEYIIDAFGLMNESDAYLQGLLDEVHEISVYQPLTLLSFLEHFHSKEDKLGITLPSDSRALQVMTIHQAKGLEFPIVIFPYADLTLYGEKDPKIWLDLNPEEFSGFEQFYIPYNKYLLNMGEDAESLYYAKREEMEFDTINLLYVVFTRAIRQLYVIGRKKSGAKGTVSRNTTSGLLIHFLNHLKLWSDDQDTYEFGGLEVIDKPTDKRPASILQDNLRMTNRPDWNIAISTKSGMLWDSRQKQAQERGNIIHQIMANIKTYNDIDQALNKAVISGLITEDQFPELKNTIGEIVNHPQIKSSFHPNCTVFLERPIMRSDKSMVIPDRVVILPNQEGVVIDYKTGQEKPDHIDQITAYAHSLSEMNISVAKRYLIYIDEAIEVKEV